MIFSLGIYMFVYNYSVHSEMKRYSGRGIGGGVALLLTFVGGIAMPFVTPSEISSCYATRGRKAPVQGMTGLWVVLPVVVGYIVFFAAAISSAAAISTQANGTTTGPGVGVGIALGVAYLLFVGGSFVGNIVWFVKTNGALNDFWLSIGARPA